jgi:trk system potassium uptake protein TrkA
MRIVIVGAGAVGSHLAERLSMEGQDVVIIDNDPLRVDELQANLDVLAIQGNGASPAVLEMAGISKAELVIAVTSSDAVNVLACHAAARLGVPRKIARVEDPALRDELEVLGVDVAIDPIEELARELLMLVKERGVSEHIEFGNGDLTLLGAFVQPDARLASITLEELREQVTEWNWLIAAVIRHGDAFVARGDFEVHGGDHVLLMAKSEILPNLTNLFGISMEKASRVMIFGAGRLARLTANLFKQNGISVTMIDRSKADTQQAAEECDGIIVVHGDPTDPELLREEGIESVDEVLALTRSDETNILSCLVAKGLGVRSAIARYHRLQYVGLLTETRIDAGVSARLAAANAILRFVRRGRIHSVVTFQDSDLEAIELQVDHASESVGQSLRQVALPKTAIIAGVIRGSETFVPRGETVIYAGDRLIAIALPDAIPSVEKVFG